MAHASLSSSSDTNQSNLLQVSITWLFGSVRYRTTTGRMYCGIARFKPRCSTHRTATWGICSITSIRTAASVKLQHKIMDETQHSTFASRWAVVATVVSMYAFHLCIRDLIPTICSCKIIISPQSQKCFKCHYFIKNCWFSASLQVFF